MEYRKNKRPTTKPPHQNTYNHDILTVRRPPICRNQLFDALAAKPQPTPPHFCHLINLHPAAIALPISSLCSTHRPTVALQLLGKPMAALHVLQGTTSRSALKTTDINVINEKPDLWVFTTDNIKGQSL